MHRTAYNRTAYPRGVSDDRGSINTTERAMDTARLKALTEEILGLPEPE
jgi:hypothetical protein